MAPQPAPPVINPPETPLFGANAQYLQRNVSDTGQVFFNTTDPLLPTDNNGRQNVYEYEQGDLSLLSTGASVDDSLFIDASPSGNDVFITTSQQLLPQDTDRAMDVYDARVGGGFPFSAPAPAVHGRELQAAPTATPPVPPAATVTFSGPGNVKSSHKKKSKNHKKGKKHKKGNEEVQALGAGDRAQAGRHGWRARDPGHGPREGSDLGVGQRPQPDLPDGP